jgi:hypothetical protein
MLRSLGEVKEGEFVTLPACPARGCLGVSGTIERDEHGRLGLREYVYSA